MTQEFPSLSHLAAHVGEIALKQHETGLFALEKAAKVVEKQAKDDIGEYQEEAGPFAAWAELADSTKEDRLRKGFTENDPGLRTGDMRDSIGHQVEGTEAQVGSNDDRLVYFELGTSKQPPRSVLGGAAVKSLPKVCAILGESAVLALTGEQVHEGRMLIEEQDV